jgi:hypothetical protein
MVCLAVLAADEPIVMRLGAGLESLSFQAHIYIMAERLRLSVRLDK